MFLSRSKDRIFHELTEELYMFERNFVKTENGDIAVQEALAVSRLEKLNDKNYKFISNSFKVAFCNYCHHK